MRMRVEFWQTMPQPAEKQCIESQSSIWGRDNSTPLFTVWMQVAVFALPNYPAGRDTVLPFRCG